MSFKENAKYVVKKNIYVFHCLCVDSQDDSPLGAKLHGCATHQKESFY